MNIFQEERQLIFQHFPNLTAVQKKQLIQLEEIYTFWNERINVISRKDIPHLYLHHVLHALSIAKIISFLPGAEVLDVGTGGGFPGIPLAIMFPHIPFYLNDSIQKKIHVVNEVKKILHLPNVKTIHSRAEHIRHRFDFIVGRAVTNFQDFLKLSQGKIKSTHRHTLPNGILYLKGGTCDVLQQELGKYYKNSLFFHIHDFFPYPYFENKYLIHYAYL